MSLQIICGRSHCGKSSYLTDIIKQKAAAGEKVMLVVPEQFTHAAEVRVLRATGRIQDNLLEITSFKRLANRTRVMLGDMRRNIISPIGKSLVLADALEAAELEYFGGSAGKTGFVDLCLDTVSELKKYNLTAEDVADMSEKTDDPVLKIKLKDLYSIYTLYDEKLHTSYVDTDDILDILGKNLADNNLYGDFTFFFDEFSSFVPQERRIISQILAQAKDVYITLCMDAVTKDGLFRPAEDTYRQLREMCREIGCGINKTVYLENSCYSSPELAFIEKNLFSYPTKVFEGKNNAVSLIRAANPFAEVETVALQITSLVRDEGIRYRDISVICSDMSGYDYIFDIVFRKHKLPYFTDEKNPVLNHQVVLFVLCVLDVYLEGYSFESIFNFLKSGFTRLGAGDISVLENFIFRTNASKNTWLNDERWNTFLENYTAADFEDKRKISDIRQRYILPLADFHEKIKGRHSARYVMTELYRYLCSIGLDKTIAGYIDRFTDEGNVAAVKEYEAVWKTIITSFDEIVNIFGDRNVSVKQLRGYLYTAFSNQSIGLIPTSVDEIMIGDIARTRLDDAKVLFILGANEGVFPRPAKSSGIITDKDKELLEKLDYELPDSTDVQAYINQHLIYSVFSAADARLYVSYTVADNEYKTMSPSFSVGRLKKMFPGIEKEDFLHGYDTADLIAGERTTDEHLVAVMNMIHGGNTVPGIWSPVYAYYRENRPEYLKRIKRYFRYANIPDVLADEHIRQHIGDEFYTTISRLQKYAACHFSYFAEYMLSLKEKPRPQLKNVDIGTIAHDILEKICTTMSSDGVTFRNAGEEYFDKKIDSAIREYIEDLGYRYAELTKRQLYAVERLGNILKIAFETICRHISQSKFNPVGYEVTFDDDNIGCIEIKLDSGETLKLTGKIDRVDAYETEDKTYLRVIDYKTGHKIFNLNDVVHGLDIQLMVYLNALVDSSERNEYAGAFFFLLDDFFVDTDYAVPDEVIQSELIKATKLKGIIIDREDIQEAFDSATTNRVQNSASAEQFSWLSKYIKQMIKQLWTTLVTGDIAIEPYKRGSKTPCSYCPYSSLCRFDTARSSYRELKSYKKDEIWELVKGGAENVD
ncbi:MAG: PD-(D/E)XK nuclease family protein [Clostridia bacterium]|nr:PD-(D/E)XK nuclease family protein [Clostridia bacterium]